MCTQLRSIRNNNNNEKTLNGAHEHVSHTMCTCLPKNLNHLSKVKQYNVQILQKQNKTEKKKNICWQQKQGKKEKKKIEAKLLNGKHMWPRNFIEHRIVQ